MKKFFVSLVMLLSTSAACVFAQSSLIATLSHEGEVTAFYGANALKEAHKAADHGDAITLSSGSFNATDITKAITLRGAGMQMDTDSNVMPTILAGDFNIRIADDVTEKLVIEDICHRSLIKNVNSLTNACFMRCRLYNVSNEYESGVLDNCMFLHCIIMGSFDMGVSDFRQSHCSFVNCYAYKVYSCNTHSSINFLNCIVEAVSVDDYYWDRHVLSDLDYCSFTNCILIGTNNAGNFVDCDYLPQNATANYCVAINCYNNNCFRGMQFQTNAMSTYTELFKTYTGTNRENETFELTDEAKVKFLGTDGTQIGLYGGNMPFSHITTNPRITKCNVAAKSTADGKLSVDIEVSGAE